MLNFRKFNIESGSTAHEGPNQKSGSVTNRDMVLTNFNPLLALAQPFNKIWTSPLHMLCILSLIII